MDLIRNGDVTQVVWFFEAGWDVNRRRDGTTPAMDAARFDKVEVFEQILRYGPDLNLKSPNGNTALHFAVASKAYAVAELLVEAGADRSVKNDADHTALDVAVANGDTRMQGLLTP